MQKDQLQKVYNQEREEEININKDIKIYKKELYKLKLSSRSYRVKTNLIISLIILLVSSKSNLFFSIVNLGTIKIFVLMALFGLIYGASNLVYKLIIYKKYGVNLFKEISEKDKINEEINYNIKLEQAKNIDNINKKTLTFLNNKIKQCYNGLPLFSKNYFLSNKELEEKINELDDKVKENTNKVNESIESHAVNKVAQNYLLLNMFAQLIINMIIGLLIIATLPILFNLSLSFIFQVFLGIVLFCGYVVSKNITFNNAKEVFGKYGINLVSLKHLNGLDKKEEEIVKENAYLSNSKLEQLEAISVYKSLPFVKIVNKDTNNCMQMTNIETNSVIKNNKGKTLIKK